MIFLDTSLLVRGFAGDEGGDVLQGRVAPGESVVVSAICRVEFSSAIARRRRGGTLTGDQARQVLAQFAEESCRYETVGIDDVLLERAASLVERHPLRSLDGIQLSSALAVSARNAPGTIRFGSADARLNAAAKAEGLALLGE